MLTASEFMALRAIVSGTFRRRPKAPPLGECPLARGLVEKGYVRVDGNRLLITEDGLGALEAREYETRKNPE